MIGSSGRVEQAVGDLDARRAVPQRGERVDQPLRLVVACDVLLRVGPPMWSVL